MTRSAALVIKIAAALAALALLAGVAGWYTLRTEWFREKLRQRVVAELEKATGGRVEIGGIRFDPRRWHARVDRLVIHGKEEPGEEPLLRAEAVEVDLNIVSFLDRKVNVAALRILSPEIHIRVAPDGSTNLPTRRSDRPFTDALLDLEVGQFALEQGALWWNDRRYDLDIALAELRVRAQFDASGRYKGRLETGRILPASQPRLPAVEAVTAGFQVLDDRIEITDLSARTASSEIKSSGVIDHLVQPRWRLHYHATIDAREAARAIPLPELRGGRIEIEGAYDSSPGGDDRPGVWSATGKLSAQAVSAAGREFRLSNVSAAGSYSVDPARLRMDGLEIRLLGGRWSGRLTAEHSPPGRAALDGRVEGIRLEAATQALATPARPLDRAGWGAVVNGPVNIASRWPVTARTVSVEADLALSAAEGAPVPVGGIVRASYRGATSEVQLAEARLATAATSLTASGRLSERGDSSILFRAETGLLSEVTGAVLAVTGKEIQIPARLDGRAIAQGHFSGTIQRPRVEAKVDVSRFAYNEREWDSFTGQAEWSRQQARLTGGRLAKGNAAVNLNVTAALDDGRYSETSPIEAEIAVRQVEVQDLAALAGQQAPVTGALTATLKVEGTQRDPRGVGSLEMRRGMIWEEPFDSLQGAILLEGGEVRLNNLRIAKAKGSVRGSGAFHIDRKTFRFDVRGENLSLADQRRLVETGRKMTGMATFTFAGSGRLGADSSLETLAGEGDLRVEGATLDGRALGNLAAMVRTVEEKMQIEAQSDFLGSKILGKGEVLLRDRFPVQGKVEFTGLDVRTSLAAAGVSGSRAEGSGDGFFVVEGELRNPETLKVQGSVTRVDLGWSELVGAKGSPPRLRNSEPVNWRIENRKLTLETIHLVGEGTDLRSSGVVDLAPAGTVKLALNGSINLGVMTIFDPKLDTAGMATLNMNIGGTRSEPNLTGRLDLRNGAIATEEAPIGLSNINGTLTFSRQRATIQKLTAEAGGGQVNITGHADLAGGPIAYRVQVEAQRVRLRYPAGLTSILDAVLTLTGAERRSRLEGEIQITRAGTKPSIDLATILAGLKQPTRTPSSSEWLQGAQLNVSIVSAPDIQLETSLARHLEADVNLRVRGTALNPSIVGRVNITEGELEFQGTRYTLNRGDISFVNPFRIEPILNLDLETRVSGYDITLTLIGPLDKLNVTYRSDPPLTFDEVITLLAVGRAPSADPTLAARQSSQAQALTELGASTVIGEAIARPVSGRLQRFFGVSRLKVDPQLAGPGGNATARVTIEQQVGRDITFTYVYNLASAQEQIVRVEWAVNRQWSLVAIRDQNGLFGVDFFYKKRFH